MKNLHAKLKELGLEYPQETIQNTINELGLEGDKLSAEDIDVVISILKQNSGGLAIRTDESSLGSYEPGVNEEAATILELVKSEQGLYTDWLADKINAVMANTTDLAIQKAKAKGASVDTGSFRQKYNAPIRNLFTAS